MEDTIRNQILVGLGGLTIGFILGSTITFLSTRSLNKKNKSLRFNDIIAIIVLTIWSFSLVADVISPDYSMDIGVSIIAGAVIGALFNVKIDIPSRIFKFEQKEDDKTKS